MSGDYLTKNPIDFDELKKERKSCCIEKEINEEWLLEHPKSSKSLGVVAEMDKRIDEIDALLAKEPPCPELPPRQPLIKVSGVLEEIEILYARGFFTDREYEPEELARKERSNQWGSVLLAAIGESAAAAVNSQDSIRPVRSYYFVQGKINGKPFHGWLGRIAAMPGDSIELIVIDKNDHYEAYALAIPELRIVSVIPECYQGVRSRVTSEVKGIIIMALIFIGALLFYSTAIEDIGLNKIKELFIFFGTMAGMFILAGLWGYIRSSKKPKPSVLLAENIFTTMGLSEPTKVHLVKHTKRMAKSKDAIKYSNRTMPDKNCLANYLYYY